jgi:hypothetical protein
MWVDDAISVFRIVSKLQELPRRSESADPHPATPRRCQLSDLRSTQGRRVKGWEVRWRRHLRIRQFLLHCWFRRTYAADCLNIEQSTGICSGSTEATGFWSDTIILLSVVVMGYMPANYAPPPLPAPIASLIQSCLSHFFFPLVRFSRIASHLPVIFVEPR